MSENMRFWDKINRPPTSALKKIQGGRMSGKTDISPMWRIQAMTELFGPCGLGWKYTIDKLWTEPGEGGQVTAFALVSVSYFENGTWSTPIPGIGGSMLVAREKDGHHTSDEAYKMAVTDALSVALKAIGMAAEIYLGNYDGSKYKNMPAAKAQQEETKPGAFHPPPGMDPMPAQKDDPAPAGKPLVGMASENQLNAIYAITRKLGISPDMAKLEMSTVLERPVSSSKELCAREASVFIDHLKALEAKV